MHILIFGIYSFIYKSTRNIQQINSISLYPLPGNKTSERYRNSERTKKALAGIKYNESSHVNVYGTLKKYFFVNEKDRIQPFQNNLSQI